MISRVSLVFVEIYFVSAVLEGCRPGGCFVFADFMDFLMEGIYVV